MHPIYSLSLSSSSSPIDHRDRCSKMNQHELRLTIVSCESCPINTLDRYIRPTFSLCILLLSLDIISGKKNFLDAKNEEEEECSILRLVEDIYVEIDMYILRWNRLCPTHIQTNKSYTTTSPIFSCQDDGGKCTAEAILFLSMFSFFSFFVCL